MITVVKSLNFSFWFISPAEYDPSYSSAEMEIAVKLTGNGKQ